jgi:hypothetical protein
MQVKVTCLTILTGLTVFSINIKENISRLHHLYLYKSGSKHTHERVDHVC